jgi:pimeloyl-ACP methyl ester carboxylesterase
LFEVRTQPRGDQFGGCGEIADARSGLPSAGVAAEGRRVGVAPELSLSPLAEEPERFSLAAHGMGGCMAFGMLRAAPWRIRRLAPIGTLPSADGPAQIARRERSSALVRQGRYEDVVEQRLPMLFHPDRLGDAALVDEARRMARDVGAERFLDQQCAIVTRPDSETLLAAIRCPTLVVVARDDAIAPMTAATPGTRFEIDERSGQFAMLERPRAVSRLLHDWLRGPVA